MKDIRPWPQQVDWVHQPFERYLTAIYNGPDGHKFPWYNRYDIPWIVGYMVPMAWFESRGNPNAVNRRVYSDPMRQAHGVYQHLPMYWEGRVKATISKLRKVGYDDPWMNDPLTFDPLPDRKGTGILHPEANISVAAYLFGLQGPGGWSPSRTFWKPENYRPGTWLWVEGEGWARYRDGRILL